MKTLDYLSAFAEANKIICEGADERQVLNLITRQVTLVLKIKGCLIKVREDARPFLQTRGAGLALGQKETAPEFSEPVLTLVSSFGLTQDFIFSKQGSDPDSILSKIPDETLYVSDIRKLSSEPTDGPLLAQEGLQSYILFPILVRGEKVAMAALFDDQPRELTREEIKFAKAIISRGISALIAAKQVEYLLQRQRLYLESFQQIAHAINSTLNINKVLELAVETITKTLGIKGTQIRLLDQKTMKLKLAASYGLSDHFLQIGPVYSKRDIEGGSSEVIVIENVATDERIQYRDEILAENARQIVTLPLIVRNKNIGELTLFTRGGRSFTDEEISFVNAIAQQCAFAIENARMYQRVKYEFQQLMVDFGYDGSS